MPNCLSVRGGLVCKNRGLRRFVWTASVRTADERTGEALSALRILRRLVFLLLAAPHRQTDMKSIHQYRRIARHLVDLCALRPVKNIFFDKMTT